jgi:arsenical pump membrane protein
MAVPWVVVCIAEWATLRVAFRAELAVPRADPPDVPVRDAPRYALAVLAVTITGFVVASSLHVNPAYAAFGGCVLLLLRRTAVRRPRPLLGAASPGFCLFVLALAVIVDGVTRHGLGAALGHVVPSHSGVAGLLAMAFIAAVLANLVNNLPATLILLPFVAGHPALALAMLVGVNIGPNATYPGSLATLLWRRLLPESAKPRARQFHRLGLLTVPVILGLTTLVLWGAVTTIGA